ncbi:hypothetical protein CF15_06835 [Pyrodictium occultum]|uniref:Uncharacterized protein n=1 Tax=Pyrodictium occultum TaxID=2309 RepID=A0A0V8RWN0_PYROC|nr:hypothetical protein [Pyrodictium occultum]KSW12435.1 hypothetical protein CF15_06835 [Pyrodictium occultum]
MREGGKLARLLEKALKPIVEALGIDINDVENLEIDPYGPRVVLEARPRRGRTRSVFLDASPDGVELVASLEAPRGLDPRELEERLAELLEESPETQGVEEYDVDYDPEAGEARITLHARLVAELPGVGELERLLEEALGGLQTGGRTAK